MSVPLLRFKDEAGQDFSDWETATIGERINEKSSKFNPEKNADFMKCIELEHLSQNTGELLGYTDTSNSKSIKNKFENGDVLFGKLRPYLKKYLKAPFSGVCSTEIWVLKGKGISNDYLFQFVQTESFITQANISSGSKMPRADWGVVSSAYSYFPCSKEQIKIANFLTAVDEKITQLTQKHDLLSQYKKGVIQQIFSQELRFKDDDGQDFPEWDDTTLGDVCKPQQWKTIAASELTEFGYPAYGANGQIGFYSNYNHEDETVAVTCRGATCGEVSLIPPKSYITGNAMSLDEINPDDNNHRYMYYALILRGFRDVISGSAQPQIVGSAIRKVEFAKPTINEQTKIANFLTAIDDKITTVQTQLQAVKQYKQGLLQQMFV